MNATIRIALAVVMIIVAAASFAVASGQVSANQPTTQPQQVSPTDTTNPSDAVPPSDPQAPEATTYYAAPNGSPSGDGSIARPWDLQTALNQPSALRPGDTVRLRGGTYQGTFNSHLSGTSGAPITIRSAPGEWAVIDSHGSSDDALNIGSDGSFAIYRDFELTDSLVPNCWCNGGIFLQAHDSKLINLVVQNNHGQGIAWWIPSYDSEVYGNIISENGSTSNVDHGIYTQNQNGTKRLIDNIIVNNSTYQTQVYGSGASYLRNYIIDGNNFFFGGNAISGDHSSNFLIGTGAPGENIRFTNNYLYRQNANNTNTNLSQGTSGNHDLVAQNNYFADGGPSIRFGSWNNLNFTGNTIFGSGTTLDYLPSTGSITFNNNEYYSPSSSSFTNNGSSQSFAQWRSSTGFDFSSQFSQGSPGANRIFIRPNQYEQGRANITIFNWQHLGTVNVDLSSVVSPGSSYEVRNSQNYGDMHRSPSYGDPPLTGVCPASGSCVVSIPMNTTRWTVARPVLGTTPPNTLPEFGVFIVRTTGANGTPVPTSSPTRTPIATRTLTPLATRTPGGPTATRTPTPATPPGLSWEAESGTIAAPFVVTSGPVTYVSQTSNTFDPTQGGRASYRFNISTPGTYVVKMVVNGPSFGTSIFFNIDTEPADDNRAWDVPYTNGAFQEYIATWSWSGGPDPRTFALSAGQHELIVRGRERDAQIDRISIVPYPPTTPVPTLTFTRTNTPPSAPTATPTTVPGGCQAVTWTNTVNVTVAGNTIQKTGGSPGTWDAGAVSTVAIRSGDGYVQATVDALDTYRMFGLSNGNSGVLQGDIDFAAYLAGNTLMVYERGLNRGTFGTVAVGDVIKVSIESGVVKYYKNGAVFYISSAPARYPLLLDTSINSSLGRVSNALICAPNLGPNATFTPTPAPTAPPNCQAVSWMNLVNVTVTGNSIQKTGGSPGTWDAGAASTVAIQSGNGYVQATVDALNTYRMFGLSNGNASVLHQDIDYAAYLAGNTLKVYEGNSDRGTFGTVAVGDVIKVSIEGGVVKYYKNGAVFYTSSGSPKYPMLLDTAINSSGGRVSSAYICGGSLGNSPPRPPK